MLLQLLSYIDRLDHQFSSFVIRSGGSIGLELMIGLVHFVEGKHAMSTSLNFSQGTYDFMDATLKMEWGIDTKTNQYVGSLPDFYPGQRRE
jgi:hypothetical protein